MLLGILTTGLANAWIFTSGLPGVVKLTVRGKCTPTLKISKLANVIKAIC